MFSLAWKCHLSAVSVCGGSIYNQSSGQPMNLVHFGGPLQGELVITVEAREVAGPRRGKRMTSQVTSSLLQP